MKKYLLASLLALFSFSYGFSQNYEWLPTNGTPVVDAGAMQQVFTPGGSSATSSFYALSVKDYGGTFKFWVHQYDVFTQVWEPRDSASVSGNLDKFWIDQGSLNTNFGFALTDYNLYAYPFDGNNLTGLHIIPSLSPITGFTTNDGDLFFVSNYDGTTTAIVVRDVVQPLTIGTYTLPDNPGVTKTSLKFNDSQNVVYVAERDNLTGYVHTVDPGGPISAPFGGQGQILDVNNGGADIQVNNTGAFKLIQSTLPEPSLVYQDISNKVVVVPLSTPNLSMTYIISGTAYTELGISQNMNKMAVVTLDASFEMETIERDFGTQNTIPVYVGATINGALNTEQIHIGQLDGSGRLCVSYKNNITGNYDFKISNYIPQVTSHSVPLLCTGASGAQLLIDSIFVEDPDFDFGGITTQSSNNAAVVTSAGLVVQFDGGGGFYYITTDSLRSGGNVDIQVTLDDAFGNYNHIFNASVHEETTTTLNPIACNEFTVPSGDETYTSSGTYSDTLLSVSGCDSLFVINLTVNYTQFNTLSTQIACNELISPSGLYTWTVDGTYEDTLFGAALGGCDSILTIPVDIIQPSLNTLSTQIGCDSLVSPSGLHTWYSDGTYQDTLFGGAANGCDSILTVPVTIHNSQTGSENHIECNEYFWPINSTTYTSSGVYIDTIPTVNGCDSIITLTLTINTNGNSSISETHCESYTSPSGNNTWTTSGIYNDTIFGGAVSGCDSVIVVNLTINYNQLNTLSTQTACLELVSPSGLYTWTASGTYQDTLFNGTVNGCDSILTIPVDIIQPSFNTLSTQIGCDSIVSPSGLYTWTTSGTYQDTLFGSAINGCDSILTVPVTINYAQSTTIARTRCNAYTSPSGNYTWTSSGIYYDTIYGGSINGCDSTFTIALTINNSTPVAFNFPSYDFCTNGQEIDFELETGISGGFYQIGNVYLTQNGYFDPAAYDQTLGNTNSIDFTYINNFGCTSTASATANFFLPADITLNITDASCGANNGGIVASVVNNNTTFTSFWNTGAIDVTTISNLTPGSYYLEVEDDKGCISNALGTVQATDITITESITDVTCFGAIDGAIDITIVGAGGPFTFLWSNGTSQEDAINLNAGVHSVTVFNSNGCMVTKNFTVGGPLAPNVQSTTADADCGLSNGNIFLGTPNNLVGPLNFNWDNGATTPSNLNVGTGTYTLTITDANGCNLNHTASVGTLGGIQVNGVVTNSSCNSSDGQIALFEGPVSVDTIATVSWDNGMSSTTITGLAPGTYISTVTTATGCSTVNSWIVGTKAPLVNPICIVTVDSLTTTNLVVWEKVETVAIDHYKIYRETPVAGVYEEIDTVSAANISVFNDVVASPAVNSWRYKISAVNDCGIESPKSLHHKTIHLTFTSVGGQANIFFDDYEGIVYSVIDLYRYSNENGWELVQTLPSNQYTFVDPNISGLTGLDYLAEVTPSSVCTATTGKAQDYNSSRSNKAEGKFNPGDGTGDSNNNIVELSNGEFGAMVYPNPTNGLFHIDITNEEVETLSYMIVDLNGSVVSANYLLNGMNKIDISTLSNGMYIVKIFSSNTTEIVRVVKN